LPILHFGPRYILLDDHFFKEATLYGTASFVFEYIILKDHKKSVDHTDNLLGEQSLKIICSIIPNNYTENMSLLMGKEETSFWEKI
jgi:hypothetical protein